MFPDFTPREDLLRIAAAFKLQDAGKHVAVLEELSRQRGRIRIVFNVLQKAKRRAEAEGSKVMRVSHIRAVLESTSLKNLVKGEE